jgi:3,4-dihydroxy 2-butanone 4-phosphate synthase/GTP cyclohydrolase II
VAEVLRALAAGDLAVLIDGQHDTADLIGVAEHTTADSINFMAREGCGLICVALSAALVERLELRPMAAVWEQPSKPFTVSIDARVGITTGISAAERAHTIRTAVAPGTRPSDLVVPGHVFPLRARPGRSPRAGRTEAALALAGLASRSSGAVVCELLDEVGEVADAVGARRFARQHGLPVVDVASALAAQRADDRRVRVGKALVGPEAPPAQCASGS